MSEASTGRVLVILSGLPATGKSTAARVLAEMATARIGVRREDHA